MSSTIIRRYLSRSVQKFTYKPVKRVNLILPKDVKVISDDSKKSTEDSSKKAVSKNLLSQHLKSKILATGPITIAEYMKEVLTNPAAGYYMRKDVFGQHGDFITSPEIGQIFGELIAVWCLNEWKKIGAPAPFQLVELGPGRGTLTKDILRVFAKLRLQKEQFSIHLVEISPTLSEIQAQRLCYQHKDFNPETQNVPYYRAGETASGIKVFWYRQLEDIPEEFSIVLAHEFFDALPVHKLQKIDNIWKEILVDVNLETTDNPTDNKFRLVISNSQTPASKIFKPIENEKRDSLEYSIETQKILLQLATRLERNGGIGLIMDYGHFGEKTDTFRAFKKHKLHDPLIDPGTADLTADVDFKYMKWFAEKDEKLITFGPVEQGSFLKQMEGDARLKVLLENCSPENEEDIKTGYDMLTNPKQMGKRFKFFALFPAVLKNHLDKFSVSGFSNP